MNDDFIRILQNVQVILNDIDYQLNEISISEEINKKITDVNSLLNFDINLLKELLSKENIDVNTKEFTERLDLAKNWVSCYGSDYQVNLLVERNNEFYNTLNELEKEWLKKTILLLKKDYSTTDDLQTALYNVVKDGVLVDKELKQTQKRYFQILYNMLLGKEKGPKLGLFLMAVDKEYIKKIL